LRSFGGVDVKYKREDRKKPDARPTTAEFADFLREKPRKRGKTRTGANSAKEHKG